MQSTHTLDMYPRPALILVALTVFLTGSHVGIAVLVEQEWFERYHYESTDGSGWDALNVAVTMLIAGYLGVACDKYRSVADAYLRLGEALDQVNGPEVVLNKIRHWARNLRNSSFEKELREPLDETRMLIRTLKAGTAESNEPELDRISELAEAISALRSARYFHVSVWYTVCLVTITYVYFSFILPYVQRSAYVKNTSIALFNNIALSFSIWSTTFMDKEGSSMAEYIQREFTDKVGTSASASGARFRHLL